MRKSILVMGVGLLFITGSAVAQDEEEAASEEAAEAPASEEAAPAEEPAAAEEEAAPAKKSSGGGPAYGPAGCGLGSMVFDPDSGFTQVLAATTNGTSANQTFGITSGTSNCDTGPDGSDSAKAFVETNRTALAKDIARGKGETISGLTELAGCKNSAAVGARLQRGFKNIFPSAAVSDREVGERVIGLLKSDGSLSCSQLI